MDTFRGAIVLPTTNPYGTIPLIFILLTSAIGTKQNKTLLWRKKQEWNTLLVPSVSNERHLQSSSFLSKTLKIILWEVIIYSP